MVCCCPVTLLAIIGGIFALYKWFNCCNSCKKQPEIHEKNYKKDVVYLYQFPKFSTVPSASPFVLKVESFLRLHKIEYKNIHSMTSRSKYGLLPFIELNGEHIADSQIIIERLKKHFNIESDLPAREEALARATGRFIENHTFYVLIHYKILEDTAGFIGKFVDEISMPNFVKPLATMVMSFMFRRKVTKRTNVALGAFSEEEFRMLLDKDLSAIRDILGEKDYLFGDKPHETDLLLFGQLASICYFPSTNTVKTVIREEYPTLLAYQERLKALLWPTDFEMN